MKGLLNTFPRNFETFRKRFQWLFTSSFCSLRIIGGHVEGMLDNRSNNFREKSKIFCWESGNGQQKTCSPQHFGDEKILWTRTKRFWWPVPFFCQNPAKHQLKVRNSRKFFWNPFFLQNFPLDLLKAVFANQPKISPNIRIRFAQSRKKRIW